MNRKKLLNLQLYWEDVSKRFDKHLQKLQNPSAIAFAKDCFAYFSFITEDHQEKAKKHYSLLAYIHPLIVELHDLLRSVYICQANLLLASSACNLRTIFEIRCNLKFIYEHNNPEEMCKRFNDYAEYEALIIRKYSAHLTQPEEGEEENILKKHPYWGKDGKLKNHVEWHGQNFKYLACDIIGLKDEYIDIYKNSSKFVHGSPVVRNAYASQIGLTLLPGNELLTSMNILACTQVLFALKEFLMFFGIEFNEDNFLQILDGMPSVKK